MQREHVGVALAQDHPPALCTLDPGRGDPVEHLTLAVDLALRRVQILRSVVVAHRARAETAHAPARVCRGEHDAAAEAVNQLIGTGLLAPAEVGGQDLIGAVARLAGRGHDPIPGVRRVADTELTQDLLVEAPLLQVVAGRLRLPRLPQKSLVEGGGPVEQRVQPLAPLAACRSLRRLVLGLELDAETVRQRLERALEVEPLGEHHEGERVAGLRTAEAVVVLLVGAHVERRRALVMERAAAEVAVDAAPRQLHLRADERQHVDRVAHAVARIRGVATHGVNAVGTASASNIATAKRSVMPAM